MLAAPRTRSDVARERLKNTMTMKSLSPNTLLQNRYLVVNLIGKGGMGEVYLAIDQRLGNHVALKRTIFTDDEVLAIAFEREARTLANLRHKALTKVSDHFTGSGSRPPESGGRGAAQGRRETPGRRSQAEKRSQSQRNVRCCRSFSAGQPSFFCFSAEEVRRPFS